MRLSQTKRRAFTPDTWPLSTRSLVQGGVLGLAVGGWILSRQVPAGTLGAWVRYEVSAAVVWLCQALPLPQGVLEAMSFPPWSFLVPHEVYAAGVYALGIALFTSAAITLAVILGTLEEELAPAIPSRRASPPIKAKVSQNDPAPGRERDWPLPLSPVELAEPMGLPPASWIEPSRPVVPGSTGVLSPAAEESSYAAPDLAVPNQQKPDPAAWKENRGDPVPAWPRSYPGKSTQRGQPSVALLSKGVQVDLERRQPISIKLSNCYLDHWGLLQCPFENTPDPRYYFPSSHHQEALHRLLYGVQARKGAVMLTGEIGCGKTLMSRALLQQLPADTYDTALIAAPAFEATHLLREILYQLGVDSVGTGGDLLHRLNDRLLDNYKRGLDTVLIIDEAQAIRDERMFEEIRLMLNFQLNDRFLLTLVLLGQPELKARVESITQLSQRIAIRHHLSPFTAQETAEYVRYRINRAGGHKETFTDEACFLIHSESGGIPRRINSLCDLCLLIGFMDHVRVIDRPIVLRAGAEITLGRRR